MTLMKPRQRFGYREITAFWTRSRHRLWHKAYSVWVSPDHRLIAYLNDALKRVAIVWDTRAGRRVHMDREALYDLFRVLGGWI